MALKDSAFQRAFRGMFVYNILFEDSDQDQRYLGIDEDSTVLSIAAAGCGVASMLAAKPKRIDAVDINRHHLALAGLKMYAAKNLKSYDDYYRLLGMGSHYDAKALIGSLQTEMPDWMVSYWAKHWTRFQKSLYLQGLTSKMLSGFRQMTGVDGSWLRKRVDESVEERWAAVDETIAPVLRKSWVSWMLDSPFQLLALGVNYSQKERILATEPENSLAEFFISHIKRVATTDLENNWFAWYALAGHFNHGSEKAVPPYLRRSNHEKSVETETDISLLRTNIFDRLDEASPNTWSHYTLCDAPDWMGDDVQRRLLDEVYRTSRDGAVLLTRSVENDSFVERIDDGKRFQRMDTESDAATLGDLSKQYRRVDFHRVHHAA